MTLTYFTGWLLWALGILIMFAGCMAIGTLRWIAVGVVTFGFGLALGGSYLLDIGARQ